MIPQFRKWEAKNYLAARRGGVGGGGGTPAIIIGLYGEEASGGNLFRLQV